MLPRMFYRGVILYFCWLWFVAPVFGLPPLPLWESIPISGLISLLTFERIGEIENATDAWITVGRWWIGATVFLAAAYAMHIMR